ncbi:aspartyl/glutamyl-tRNA(Asn/Gln) amidotransferase subunit C [Geothermobacter ehrlichii]|uniref:Aspartyl/glutamyl-tRNA(Asn/Gln) amidotransferase subunit C n=1 Tax=Geothermobacter ehrlichii TaxID=213224 RepID=A0A5D3WKE3_9BACT|nr:Asp-tRNA(Asn)/Glu-tRNA(Gln) amidotransferase subunit GatC [Geothermobacter ehrlichii]TYO99081.1 aspartyl/glutamyl-tRNA(Asn/Gln) amidotransferase subunit C [Geothermobacter ehrlichii]
MKITRDQVAQVARLARLELAGEELERLTVDMEAILSYVDKLNELDTDGIEPTSHAVPVDNAFRPDEVRPSIGLDKALANAPQREEDCFVVPRVIE